MSWITSATNENFQRARRQALISRIASLLQGKTNDLLSLEEVSSRVRVRGQRHLGLHAVPLGQIVGSEGRYGDFDRKFAPRHDNTKYRWISIDRAYYEDVSLPAVELYKIGEIYFVKDGNHRVSVARQREQSYIDALVTELLVDVPISQVMSVRDLLVKEEYSDFLSWTGLAELRPEQRIELSDLGGYLRLISHINAHRYFLGLLSKTTVDRSTAVAGWYDDVYMPMIRAIRAQHALRAFPGLSEADLYLWVMDHRWFLHKDRGGDDPGPEAAVADYVRRYGRKGPFRMFLQWVWRLRTRSARRNPA